MGTVTCKMYAVIAIGLHYASCLHYYPMPVESQPCVSLEVSDFVSADCMGASRSFPRFITQRFARLARNTADRLGGCLREPQMSVNKAVA